MPPTQTTAPRMWKASRNAMRGMDGIQKRAVRRDDRNGAQQIASGGVLTSARCVILNAEPVPLPQGWETGVMFHRELLALRASVIGGGLEMRTRFALPCFNSVGPRSRRLPSIVSDFLSVVAAVALSLISLPPSPVNAQAQTTSWISSWTASPQAPLRVVPASFSNRTIRQIVHLSIGGNKIRLRLSSA